MDRPYFENYEVRCRLKGLSHGRRGRGKVYHSLIWRELRDAKHHLKLKWWRSLS